MTQSKPKEEPERTSSAVVHDLQKATREMFFATAELNAKVRHNQPSMDLGISIRKIAHLSSVLLKFTEEFYYLTMNETTRINCQVCGESGAMFKHPGRGQLDGEGRGRPFHFALCPKHKAKFLEGDDFEVRELIMQRVRADVRSG